MKNDIVEKLILLTNTESFYDHSALDGEAKTVYLLAQVRKLFEHDGTLEKLFPTLQFYCNWALHVVLDRKSALVFIKRILPILTLNGNQTEAEHRALDSLLTLQSLKEELKQLFSYHCLTTSLFEDHNNWTRFIEAYSRVVQGSNLVLKANAMPSGPLNLAVRSVTVRSVIGIGFTENQPFPMEWLIKYVDGRSGELLMNEQGLSGAVLRLSDVPCST